MDIKKHQTTKVDTGEGIFCSCCHQTLEPPELLFSYCSYCGCYFVEENEKN